MSTKEEIPKGDRAEILRGNHLSKGVAWENTMGVSGMNASGWLQRGKQREMKWKCQPALMLCSSSHCVLKFPAVGSRQLKMK